MNIYYAGFDNEFIMPSNLTDSVLINYKIFKIKIKGFIDKKR